MKKLLLILTVALAGCGSNNNSNNNPEHTDYLSNKKIKEQYNDSLKDAKKANENALGNRIFRSIEELDRHEDYYYTSLDDIKDEIKFFKEKALYAQMTGIDSNAVIVREKLIKVQKKQFPQLRSKFGEEAKQMLWEHNIDVSISGKRNTTIQFVGTLFADNGNIKAVHSQLYQSFEDFRFKKVIYKWFKSQSDYTSFNIPGYKDEDIVPIEP